MNGDHGMQYTEPGECCWTLNAVDCVTGHCCLRDNAAGCTHTHAQ